jgi:diaminopimelate decarboxylase
VTAPVPFEVHESGRLLHGTKADLAVGDLLATPVTGAYGHSMGSNYNKILRPAVVFAADGDARLVVRREGVEDLLSNDVAEPTGSGPSAP